MNVSYVCFFELGSRHVHTLRLVDRTRKSLSLGCFLIIQWLNEAVCVLESPGVWLLLLPHAEPPAYPAPLPSAAACGVVLGLGPDEIQAGFFFFSFLLAI